MIRRCGLPVILLVLLCAMGFQWTASAAGAPKAAPEFSGLTLSSAAAVLMEASTGEVLYEKDAHKQLPPASISKVMTMLLVMEALDSGRIKLSDKVAASENATSKGGSQIFLEPGEEMTVEDLLKSVAVASANDACVALAEYVAGTETGFVDMMNKKAKSLGLKDTYFINTNGLPADEPDSVGNYSSAYDVAVMSRELMKHKKIHNYLTIWMDSVRDGKFVLANTNKLIRFYKGADGVKTGYTEKARHCLAATAKRDGVRVISVVLGAPDSKTRFREASQLMDIGFTMFRSLKVADKGAKIAQIKVLKGVTDKVDVVSSDELITVIRRGQDEKYDKKIIISQSISAPINKGQKLGELVAKKDGKLLGKVDLVASASIKKGSLWKVVSDTVKELIRSPFRAKAK